MQAFARQPVLPAPMRFLRMHPRPSPTAAGREKSLSHGMFLIEDGFGHWKGIALLVATASLLAYASCVMAITDALVGLCKPLVEWGGGASCVE